MARLLAFFLLLFAGWPADARFVSVDPVPADADTGANFNRYAYANDNPYRYTDPDGRWAEDLFIGVPSLAFGAKSLYDNVRGGDIGAAIVDGLGIGADAAAILIPGVPGGAGLGIRAGREAAERLPDAATVCRGGTCTAATFSNGTGVTLDSQGKLQNVSVTSSATGDVPVLSATIKHGKVGSTTVGDVRAAGGDVVPTPRAHNVDHCTLCGITAEQAEALFKVAPNPNTKK
ncbi:YD repeat protein [Lysobacter dokdonensis DS-58]|uniref:YD repeat protein n=1 Tax=Lysobacter dokdonensis DS-58 TaxID=1300345 RepID=A0A0A2X4Q5_9GAMM|nr:hypothetical protein [Lysobacter dokdonensis]KGQ20184.1 YD repeat protein [Lysobacter dokdonensis DS-58]